MWILSEGGNERGNKEEKERDRREVEVQYVGR